MIMASQMVIFCIQYFNFFRSSNDLSHRQEKRSTFSIILFEDLQELTHLINAVKSYAIAHHLCYKPCLNKQQPKRRRSKNNKKTAIKKVNSIVYNLYTSVNLSFNLRRSSIYIAAIGFFNIQFFYTAINLWVPISSTGKISDS